jgi:hypothetical protein
MLIYLLLWVIMYMYLSRFSYSDFLLNCCNSSQHMLSLICPEEQL